MNFVQAENFGSNVPIFVYGDCKRTDFDDDDDADDEDGDDNDDILKRASSWKT